uniref:Protein kinase domain-containing protein n=1 Tax=Physcomitrium patens TaxID=3218 RepID=A0A7I4FA61_PHYPA
MAGALNHQHHMNILSLRHGVKGQRAIGDYIVTRQIGSGSFAVVWKGYHKQHPGFDVAIKEIATERLNRKLQESLRREIAILQRIDHPNIIKLHDIVEVAGKCLQAQDRIHLVLEYCAGGDLAAYIQRHGKATEVVARLFMRQLGAGLQVLWNNNLMHRDLKPQNLLLSKDDGHAVLKIADFGFARSLQPLGMADTLCGSPLYMAPEVLQSEQYDAKADLWSVGAILFQLVTGRPPFSGNNHVQLLQNIMKSTEVRFPDAIMAQLHPECIDMCRKLLRMDPVERLSFEDFFTHPFIGSMRLKTQDTQVGGSTCGGTGEASETSQEELFPFSLDDEEQASLRGESSFSEPPLFSASSSSSPSLPSTEENANVGYSLSTRMGFPPTNHLDNESSVLDQDTGESRVIEYIFDSGHSDSSTDGASGDSMDTIEREYVLVTAPVISTDNLAMSSRDSDFSGQHEGKRIHGSPQKVKNLNVGRRHTTGEVGSVASNGSAPLHSLQEVKVPSDHPPTRLPSLQRFARLITEVATDKIYAGQQLESFSIQLLCLAIWKEALRVCQTWACNVGDFGKVCSNERGSISEGGESDERSAANACSLVEREFAFAVGRAESLAVHINSGIGKWALLISHMEYLV